MIKCYCLVPVTSEIKLPRTMRLARGLFFERIIPWIDITFCPFFFFGSTAALASAPWHNIHRTKCHRSLHHTYGETCLITRKFSITKAIGSSSHIEGTCLYKQMRATLFSPSSDYHSTAPIPAYSRRHVMPPAV